MPMEKKDSKCKKGPTLATNKLFNNLKRENHVSNGNKDRLFKNY